MFINFIAPLNSKPESLLSSLCGHGIYCSFNENALVQFLIQTDQDDPLDRRGYDSHNAHGAIHAHRDNISWCCNAVRK